MRLSKLKLSELYHRTSEQVISSGILEIQMSRRLIVSYSIARSGLPKQALLVLLLVAISVHTTAAQEPRSSVLRLFKLDGTFGTELPAKTNSADKSEDYGFTLRSARLEADNMSVLTRLRSVLTIANSDAQRRITEVEWRLDVYDEALRSLSQRVLQTDKVNIYAGESAVASAKFGAVLPDRMIVLLQTIKVSFDGGSAWSASEECSLGEDLRTISCKSN